MIFNALIIIIVGVIAYFHYAQGFFGATISAIIAVIAAAMAVGYHENMVATLLAGKMSDYANGMCLIAIFGVIYIGLRTFTDVAIPGNIRLPVIVDRVGGGAMGVVAGLFTAGIFALAAQSLPFGPAVGGYARYTVESNPEVQVHPPGQSRAQDMEIADQMKDDKFTKETASKLFVPVDDFLVGAVQKFSDNGSLAGVRTFESIHPNYPDELFAQRLGVQIGAQRTALNLEPKPPQVTVPDVGVFKIEKDLTTNQVDAELKMLHQRDVVWKKSPKELQLVIRVMFTKDAADPDFNVRVSPASIRLCANGVNYWPVGTLEGGRLLSNKVDDFLIVNVKESDRGADFVFFVEPADVVTNPEQPKIKPGVFVEVKRLARIDLSGHVVQNGVPASKDVKVERKPELIKEKVNKGKANENVPAAGAEAAAPFVFSSVAPSKQLFSPINTATADKDIKNQTIPSGTISLVGGTFSQLDINTSQTLTLMKQGSYAIDELNEPTGKRVVQVVGTPQPEGGDPWGWGTLRNWTLVDAAGKTYTPAGAWARVKKDTQDRMVAKYSSTGTPGDITAEDGRPTDVWIAFLVPSGTHLKGLHYNGKALKELDQQIP